MEAGTMDREAYHRGVAALKKQIKLEERVQRAEKQLTRMPRKTKEERERLYAALHEHEKGKKYPNPRVDWMQSRVAMRKPWLTALYVTYNSVRGRTITQRVDKSCQSGYIRKLQQAKEIFDEAVKLQPVG
jgi:hypothetical protein